jgi:hypothetical protein
VDVLLDPLMGWYFIEILLVRSQCVYQMGLVEDDNLVKALFAQRTHPTFSISVSAWRSKRGVNHVPAIFHI